MSELTVNRSLRITLFQGPRILYQPSHEDYSRITCYGSHRATHVLSTRESRRTAGRGQRPHAWGPNLSRLTPDLSQHCSPKVPGLTRPVRSPRPSGSCPPRRARASPLPWCPSPCGASSSAGRATCDGRPWKVSGRARGRPWKVRGRFERRKSHGAASAGGGHSPPRQTDSTWAPGRRRSNQKQSAALISTHQQSESHRSGRSADVEAIRSNQKQSESHRRSPPHSATVRGHVAIRSNQKQSEIIGPPPRRRCVGTW